MGPSQVCIYIQKEAKIEFYLGYTHTHICIYENLHIHLLCMCYIFYTVVYILKYSCIFILCIYLCIYNKLWNILKEMGIPEHLICLLRNLYAAEEATIRTRHGTTDWSKIGKGVRQDCILSPFLFNLYAEYIISDDGRDWCKRRRGRQRMRWLDGITDSMDVSRWTPGVVLDRRVWHAAIHGVTKSRTRLSDWSDLIWHHAKCQAGWSTSWNQDCQEKYQ